VGWSDNETIELLTLISQNSQNLTDAFIKIDFLSLLHQFGEASTFVRWRQHGYFQQIIANSTRLISSVPDTSSFDRPDAPLALQPFALRCLPVIELYTVRYAVTVASRSNAML
jgi:hypothetical protein